jgi:hypothetical protein
LVVLAFVKRADPLGRNLERGPQIGGHGPPSVVDLGFGDAQCLNLCAFDAPVIVEQCLVAALSYMVYNALDDLIGSERLSKEAFDAGLQAGSYLDVIPRPSAQYGSLCYLDVLNDGQ